MNKLSIQEHIENLTLKTNKMASKKWDTLAWSTDTVCTKVELAWLCLACT